MICSSMRTQRIRDPIHAMIVFDERKPLDMTAWRLVQTPEVQRLRRVKQLGLSEFVFPAATHTRFSHSLGVYHNARRLIAIIAREIVLKRVEGELDEGRARVAMLAALLHDIGHGPFSHAFEEARKVIAARRSGNDKVKIRKHEAFTAEMIRSGSSQLGSILNDGGVSPDQVADLIEAETPTDMYHAVVSSSFDADRLDYLQRDRYMAGVESGAIDLEWLMDNVRVAEIDVSAPGDEAEAAYRHSFCLLYKAREAAEDFLLARYRLYTNVYFHKTTRGIEQLLAALFRLIAEASEESGKSLQGLEPDHSLVRFFTPGGDTLPNYIALDDTVVWGAIHRIAILGSGLAQNIAVRLLERDKPQCLDVQVAFPQEAELQRRLKHRLDSQFKPHLGSTVFRDTAKLGLYGEIGGDDSRAHNRLMIQLAGGGLKEITGFLDRTIMPPTSDRPFERYYFLKPADYQKAEETVSQIRSAP